MIHARSASSALDPFNDIDYQTKFSCSTTSANGAQTVLRRSKVSTARTPIRPAALSVCFASALGCGLVCIERLYHGGGADEPEIVEPAVQRG